MTMHPHAYTALCAREVVDILRRCFPRMHVAASNVPHLVTLTEQGVIRLQDPQRWGALSIVAGPAYGGPSPAVTAAFDELEELIERARR